VYRAIVITPALLAFHLPGMTVLHARADPSLAHHTHTHHIATTARVVSTIHNAPYAPLPAKLTINQCWFQKGINILKKQDS
jgi:hypothetical protein